MTTPRENIVWAVLGEVDRSRDRFGEYSTSGSMLEDLQRFAVMVEEIGEVAEALVLEMFDGMFATGRPGHATDLDTELTQVAAVAIGWLIARRRTA